MKTKLILTATLLLVAITINAQTFVKVGGKATDITMSPKDGAVYVVNASGNIKKYNSRTKKFTPHGKQSKNAKSVTVHSNGSVYITSTLDEVYIDVNGRWNKIPGIKTKEIDIDKNGNIRALDASGKLKKLFQGRWKDQTAANKNSASFNQVIGRDSKVLYARFKDNAFKEFKNARWNNLNGKPLKITMDDKTGKVYAVGRNKGIYEWKSSTNKWVLLKNTRKDFKDVAVYNGKIWAIGTDKSIYYYDKDGTSQNNTTSNYSGTYRFTLTRILTYSPEQAMISKGIDVYGTIGIHLEAKDGSTTIKESPIGGKTNRIWDVSKNRPWHFDSKYWKKMRSVNAETTNGDVQSYKYYGEMEVDKIREFKIKPINSNKNYVFDIQSNITQKLVAGELKFNFQRLKIPFIKLDLNKERFFTFKGGKYPGTYIFIGYKIEKTN
ncbi:MAG: hypothetical protein HRU50_08140 [Winogradskyella sp.]|uniref:hypothetical protein n=1 Tax=Winogradskyella sp. TaxID=1883156 RepID=UPI0025EBDADE|nr:hypothetical protein [Winogradskyella sp.]NRB59886.1 hypothetical protein [Winogradskyella sp.]